MAKTLICEILSPLFGLFLISNWFIGSDNVIRFVEAHRPDRVKDLQIAHAEGQLLHIESRSRNDTGKPRVLIVGSSSVFNGVDEHLINAMLAAAGANFEVVNCGLTGMHAYELPMLRQWLLRSNVAGIVYLYNYYSFSDDLYDMALPMRWNTLEFARLNGIYDLRLSELDNLAAGVLGESLFLVRYRQLLRYTAIAWSAGHLETRTYPYDFEPGRARPETTVRRTKEPAVEEPGLTLQDEVYGKHDALWDGIVARWRLFLTPREPFSRIRPPVESSLSRHNTRGYRGLERFVELTRNAKIQFVVGPVPEPNFKKFDYMGGLPVERIDRRIQEITRKYGIVLLGRSEIADIGKKDQLFRDPIHLYDNGRSIYSTYLAARLQEVLRNSNDADTAK